MRRTIIACAVTALAVGASTATAAKLITSKDIAPGAVQTRNIGKDAVTSSRLSPGVRGLLAKAGNPGANGLNGKDGAQGAIGPKGDTGAAGAKGDTGSKGDTGAKGETGATGAAGADGAQGLAGNDGTNGLDGASAFDIWKAFDPANANGTQADFLASLKGAKGDTGGIGPTGPQGPIGPAGPKGADGSAGANGDTGAPGAQGDIGPAGPVGPIGPQGPAGVTLVEDQSPATRTSLGTIGGPIATGVTKLSTAVVLNKGSYLVAANGVFYRKTADASAPATYGTLVLWLDKNDDGVYDWQTGEGAGTAFTPAIPQNPNREASTSETRVVTVTDDGTKLYLGGFGYNEDSSGYGTPDGFEVSPSLSVVKLG